jgi:hypothetical protein
VPLSPFTQDAEQDVEQDAEDFGGVNNESLGWESEEDSKEELDTKEGSQNDMALDQGWEWAWKSLE